MAHLNWQNQTTRKLRQNILLYAWLFTRRDQILIFLPSAFISSTYPIESHVNTYNVMFNYWALNNWRKHSWESFLIVSLWSPKAIRKTSCWSIVMWWFVRLTYWIDKYFNVSLLIKKMTWWNWHIINAFWILNDKFVVITIYGCSVQIKESFYC